MDDKALRTESRENLSCADEVSSPGADERAEGKGKGKGKKSAAKEFMANVADELTDRAMRGGAEWVEDQKKKFLFPDRERGDKRREGKENADVKPSVSPGQPAVGGETTWTGQRQYSNETQGKLFRESLSPSSSRHSTLYISPSLSGTILEDFGRYHPNINHADIRIHILIPNSVFHPTRQSARREENRTARKRDLRSIP